MIFYFQGCLSNLKIVIPITDISHINALLLLPYNSRPITNIFGQKKDVYKNEVSLKVQLLGLISYGIQAKKISTNKYFSPS